MSPEDGGEDIFVRYEHVTSDGFQSLKNGVR
ncbi:MAG: cold shock domain-containing protein [Actinomycetota bacterium]|nr:cold shock domain-containing protein [Actinomycetota bacterium]